MFKRIGSNGWRRFERREELEISQAEVEGGFIIRIEDEVAVASGQGGTLMVVRPSYVFVPSRGQEYSSS